jgi:hypothetical protein
MSTHQPLAALTLVALSTSGLLALSVVAALLWLGLPWLVLGLILAPLTLILSLI